MINELMLCINERSALPSNGKRVWIPYGPATV